MKAQKTINIETLIPSTLLEEVHSEDENTSNEKFEGEIHIIKDIPQENLNEKVFHIF